MPEKSKKGSGSIKGWMDNFPPSKEVFEGAAGNTLERAVLAPLDSVKGFYQKNEQVVLEIFFSPEKFEQLLDVTQKDNISIQEYIDTVMRDVFPNSWRNEEEERLSSSFLPSKEERDEVFKKYNVEYLDAISMYRMEYAAPKSLYEHILDYYSLSHTSVLLVERVIMDELESNLDQRNDVVYEPNPR